MVGLVLTSIIVIILDQVLGVNLRIFLKEIFAGTQKANLDFNRCAVKFYIKGTVRLYFVDGIIDILNEIIIF